MYAHEYLGDFANGCAIFFDWNLFLDQIGGPNHVKNYCAAPIMADLEDKTLHPQLSYQFLKLIGQALLPDSVRIETTCYTDRLDCAAARNPDGSLALVVLNKTGEELPVNIRVNGLVIRRLVAGDAIASFRLA